MSFLIWLPAGQHLYLLFPLLQSQRIVLPVVLYIQPNKQDRHSNGQHHSHKVTSLEKNTSIIQSFIQSHTVTLH